MAMRKLSTQTADPFGTSSTKVIETLALLIDGNILTLGGIADRLAVSTLRKAINSMPSEASIQLP